MKFKHKVRMFRDFGFRVGLSSMCSSALRRPMALTRWKDRCILDWLREKYSTLIQKQGHIATHSTLIQTHRQNLAADSFSDTPPAIWSVWWQGENNAPELVRMCFAAIHKHKRTHPFRIITRDNFREYIDLPEHITRKVQDGTITLTHLSDIIRFYLLAEYGGLWLDATIFPVRDIPEEIYRYDYYVIKHPENPYSYGVNRDRWISFIQAAKKGSPLCRFGYEFLAEYWREQNTLIDYMLIDYALELAYQEFPEYVRFFEAVPENNPEVDSLRPIMNEVWDAQKFTALSEATDFFKLTYKHVLRKELAGCETFYGHLLRDTDML